MRYLQFGRANPVVGRIARRNRQHNPVDAKIADSVLIDPQFDNTKPDPAELRASLGLDDRRRAPAE